MITSGAIVIKGVAIPIATLNDLAAAIPTIVLGIGHKQNPKTIVNSLAPSVLPIIEDVANLIFPGAGTAVEIIALLGANAQPWTKEDEQRWWNRAQGQT